MDQDEFYRSEEEQYQHLVSKCRPLWRSIASFLLSHHCTIFWHHSFRFRDQQLLEVLESAYGMMRNDCLISLQALLGAASSWQQYEVALYGIRAVGVRSVYNFIIDCPLPCTQFRPTPSRSFLSHSVKGRVLNRVGSIIGTAPNIDQSLKLEAEVALSIVSSVMSELCRGTGNAAG